MAGQTNLPTAGTLSLGPLSASAVNVAGLSPAAAGAAPGSVLPSAVAVQAAMQAPFTLALPPLTLGSTGTAAGAGAGVTTAGAPAISGFMALASAAPAGQVTFAFCPCGLAGLPVGVPLLPLSPQAYSFIAGFIPLPFAAPFAIGVW